MAKTNLEEIALSMETETVVNWKPLPSKNIEGTLGPRCFVCSGLGRIGNLLSGSRGGSQNCVRCMGTGVEPLTPIEQRELLGKVKELCDLLSSVPEARLLDSCLTCEQKCSASKSWLSRLMAMFR